MDGTSLAFTFILFILLILLVPFAIKRKREHLSGEYGERRVSELLDEIKEEDEIEIKDFIASRNRNNTSSIQIDHIFISHKGIFVIETKDYRGRIYGSRNQTNWTQVLAYGNSKNRLYNPVKQNDTHCNYIRKMLNNRYPVYNVVIFIKADLRWIDDCECVVFSPYRFGSWYKELPEYRYMDTMTILDISNKILSEMDKRPISKEEHIENIHRRHG